MLSSNMFLMLNVSWAFTPDWQNIRNVMHIRHLSLDISLLSVNTLFDERGIIVCEFLECVNHILEVLVIEEGLECAV